jgi:hypothetical protein
MTTEEPRSGLPLEFLHAIAAEAVPDSPPIRMAVEKARNLPEGTHRDDLLLALLRGALSDSAPEWLFQAAIRQRFPEGEPALRKLLHVSGCRSPRTPGVSGSPA